MCPLTCKQVSEFPFWLGMGCGEHVSDVKSEPKKKRERERHQEWHDSHPHHQLLSWASLSVFSVHSRYTPELLLIHHCFLKLDTE